MGLKDVPALLKAYPHQLSGGQRQRVMIAMALSLCPRLLIADEPTTALDVTTQAQILKLIKRSQAERAMSVLLITHDFGVVADMADRVAVMRHGRIVESGATAQVLGDPPHSYTRALIAAVPKGEATLPPPPDAAPLLTVNDLGKQFRRGGFFSRARVGRGAGRGLADPVAGRDAGHRGRIRLAANPPWRAASSGCWIPMTAKSCFDGADIAHMKPGALRPLAPAHPDGVPGPFLLAQSASHGGRYRHRRPASPMARPRQPPWPTRPRCCGWWG